LIQTNNQDNDDDDDEDDDLSWKDLPVVVTLINDNVHNDTPQKKRQQQQKQQVTPEEALHRLEQTEMMIETYRNTLKSNEHLIESLEQTLLETREKAQDIWVERNRLEEELEDTLDEQDALLVMEKNGIIPRIHTAVLAFSLAYFLCGGSEYVLLFVSTVYLLEDILAVWL
jgi:DNA repair ATPase RecN